MKSLNKVTLIGNLGRDPEVKYTAAGDAVASFSIATSESWKDKTSGEKQERTEWHRCVAWRKLGEIVGQYARKGQPLYVEGQIQTRKYQDKDGAEKTITEIRVSDIILLGKAEGATRTPSGNHANNDHWPRQSSQSAEVPFDDDIPF